MKETAQKDILYLIYDGNCPLCSYCSKVIKIKHSVGELAIINARQDHPLVNEIREKGYDLNEGLIVKFQDHYYHGAEAINFLALVGSPSDFFNRLNVLIFKSNRLSKIFYPFLKSIRNLLLWLRKVPKIAGSDRQPIFAAILGEQWDKLPLVMKKHYANHPYCNETVIIKGKMTIHYMGWGNRIFPLFKWLGVWVPFKGKDITVDVNLKSYPHSPDLHFERIYYFHQQKPYHFHSRMIHVKDNEVVELMPFNVGWRVNYVYEGGKVLLKHKGYVLKFFQWFIPIPLGWIMGEGNAIEQPVSEDAFMMQFEMYHPWFGKVYEYGGEFFIGKISSS